MKSCEFPVARRAAFTLVEMLVVIAIIALLLAALIPAFGVVREKAKYAATNAQYSAIDTGLQLFRGESTLGGTLPPSASDKTEDRQLIADPKGADPGTEIRISGAHLLVHALMGADGLGTPGFKDINQSGKWSDDTHKNAQGNDRKKWGLYGIDDKGKETSPRYPQGGGGYVDDKMRENAKSLQEMEDKGIVLNLSAAGSDLSKHEKMFLDAWDHPILYYRGSAAGLRITGAQNQPGIYWQEDNGIITGTKDGVKDHPGLDFGQGAEEDRYHDIKSAKGVEPTVVSSATWLKDFHEDPQYQHSFVRFILDPSVKARPTPVNKDGYLLVSAGPDGRYGTEDDVTNWTRKTE